MNIIPMIKEKVADGFALMLCGIITTCYNQDFANEIWNTYTKNKDKCAMVLENENPEVTE